MCFYLLSIFSQKWWLLKTFSNNCQIVSHKIIFISVQLPFFFSDLDLLPSYFLLLDLTCHAFVNFKVKGLDFIYQFYFHRINSLISFCFYLYSLQVFFSQLLDLNNCKFNFSILIIKILVLNFTEFYFSFYLKVFL